MAKIALLPSDSESRGEYLGCQPLPDNYMGDFSLMGFVVDRYPEALELLRAAGYHLDDQGAGTDVSIEAASRLPEIRTLLVANDISCEYTDVADSLYQA